MASGLPRLSLGPPEMQHAEARDTDDKSRLDFLQTLGERQGLCTAVSHQWLVPSLVHMIPLLLKALELDPSHPTFLWTPASIVHSPAYKMWPPVDHLCPGPQAVIRDLLLPRWLSPYSEDTSHPSCLPPTHGRQDHSSHPIVPMLGHNGPATYC